MLLVLYVKNYLKSPVLWFKIIYSLCKEFSDGGDNFALAATRVIPTVYNSSAPVMTERVAFARRSA